MPADTELGQLIRGCRKELDLTQKALAQQIACSPTTLRLIEAGRRRPSRLLGERLADALGLTPAERLTFIRLARGLPTLSSDHDPGSHAGQGTGAGMLPLTTPLAAERFVRLPTPLTPLIGRIGETQTICRLLKQDGVRLVTLVGPPGVGKTRLSLAVVAELQEEFADGVCFVDLVPVTDPTQVLGAIAEALGIPRVGPQEAMAGVVAYLGTRQMLLVLDNFEQVVEAAVQVTELLRACPLVQVLANSREPLHVYGEYVFPVPLLSLPEMPEADEPMPIAALLGHEAVQLFVARAQAAGTGLTLTSENARTVVEICRCVDGLPLAIELAAAQMKRLTPAALLEQLECRLDTLVDGPHDVPARHQTLRAAITWSYDLLNGTERELFAQLGTFEKGCTPETIQAIRRRPEVDQSACLRALFSLVDKSLVRYEVGDSGEPRLSMLQTIREYALERLAEDHTT